LTPRSTLFPYTTLFRSKTLIRNIGLIVSGDIAHPLLDGDSIVAVDGKIVAVGKGLDGDADTVIDAQGSAVIPGLLDSHCHPVFGDRKSTRLNSVTSGSR